MQEEADKDQPAPKKRLVGKRMNLLFLVVFVVAAVLITRHQQSAGGLPDWPSDISGALEQAAKEDRKILVFFASRPPSHIDIRMTEDPIRHNMPFIKRDKFITVLIQVESLQSQLARSYKVTKLPTFLVLGPDGKELNRRTGFVTPREFYEGFMDCTVIQKPAPQ